MAFLIAATRVYWPFITLCTLAGITVLSLTPLPQLPSVPGSDKTHHFIAYGLLMFPVALARPKGWLLIGAFFALWSGAIELVQPYVNRYGEWWDLAANTAGLALGAVAAWVVEFSLGRKENFFSGDE